MDEKGVGGSEYYTNKLLDAIAESCRQMESLIAIGSSSNDVLVSYSEGEEPSSCSRLEDE